MALNEPIYFGDVVPREYEDRNYTRLEGVLAAEQSVRSGTAVYNDGGELKRAVSGQENNVVGLIVTDDAGNPEITTGAGETKRVSYLANGPAVAITHMIDYGAGTNAATIRTRLAALDIKVRDGVHEDSE